MDLDLNLLHLHLSMLLLKKLNYYLFLLVDLLEELLHLHQRHLL
tara:strand:- start:49 stop:180 length:132 start_codon:yes stop_codon:yes gene_type:complete